MNFNTVLDWVKANVWIVVFVALMIAALVVMPMIAADMNANVRKKVEQRAANLTKLTNLQKTDLGGGQTGVVTQGFLERYREAAGRLSSDAKAVRDTAVAHNQKERGYVLNGVLPEMPAHMQEVLPKRFHEALVSAYQNLLAGVKAGMPPPLESMSDELHRTRSLVITQDFKKTSDEKLESEEETLLAEKLSLKRMSIYAEAAERINIYAAFEQLGVPAWNPQVMPSAGDLFVWQWRYWVAEDILKAIHELNKPYEKVTLAPVKQLVRFNVRGLPSPAGGSPGTPGGSGRTGFGGGGFGEGGGFGGDEGGGAPEDQPQAASAPSDPNAPLTPNYAISLTGRSSNGLYDVVLVDLGLVVETAKVPMLFDALGKYNFMSVIGFRLDAVDPFAAVEGGFVYGRAPVSTVSMTIETVWLRDWTAPLMPASIKQSLGISTEPPAEASASASN